MIDHLVLFAVRDDVSREDAEDLIRSLEALKDSVPGVVDLSVGENFSERAGGYTHGLFVRFDTREELRGYIEHPDHQVVVGKLEERTTGRLVVDYEHGG